MCAAMIYTLIQPVLLVVIHSIENEEQEIDEFTVIFDRIQFAQMANVFQI